MSLFAKGSPLRELVKRAVGATAVVGGTVTHVDTDEPVVALTFDDGPHPDHTPRLLTTLGDAGARATFFAVGLSARRWPAIPARAIDEGHTVANHSWDHPSFPLLARRARRLQLDWTQAELPDGAAPLFRPPWGHQTLGSRWDTWRAGLDVIAWSVMAEDWTTDPAERLVERVEAGLRPGAIVLMHDALYRTDDELARDRTPTVEAVAELLRRHAGTYRFVTVPELLERGRVRRWHYYKPSDVDWLRRQL